ncbi:MAG TPA: hypothetical protein VFD07_05000 [Candidatus Krumholzibacteria bacterium]|nr:hypothetical protein [Candidatus Krumholzibacteria bacterium]
MCEHPSGLWSRAHLSQVYFVLLSLATLALPRLLHAQTSTWTPPAQEPEPALTILRLTDGSTIHGVLVEETETYVVIESRVLGRIRVARDHIAEILNEKMESAAEVMPFDPDYNSVHLAPTPETLEKGRGYFRSFELLILNFGAAPANNLNLSIGFLFPISTSAGLLSGGFKYRILSREKHFIGFAVGGSGTIYNDGKMATLSAIVGIGDRRRSLNFSIHEAWIEDAEEESFFLVGGDAQFAGSAKFLVEYGNSTGNLFEDEDINGFVNIGLRMFWDRTSFTLTGLRPLFGDDTGDFIALPVATFSRHW